MAAEKESKCVLCDKIVDDDAFCHGCQSYVCGGCAISNPFGSHRYQDHEEEEEVEDYD